MADLDAKALLDLLMKEKEYHAKHPKDAFYSFVYALGASVASVVAAIYFSGKSINRNGAAFPLILILILLGIMVILYGFAEHGYFHSQQRKQVEKAINDILDGAQNFQYIPFWENHKSHHLKNVVGHPLKKSTDLFTSEPDTRSYWFFHDRKFELGSLLIFFGYVILLVKALW